METKEEVPMINTLSFKYNAKLCPFTGSECIEGCALSIVDNKITNDGADRNLMCSIAFIAERMIDPYV